MKRKVVVIDEDKCNGCGLCVPSCHEGAIAVIDGKARLVKDSYCDGLGNCLGQCPQDAIRIEVRQAKAFDPEAVEAHLAERRERPAGALAPSAKIPDSGCPGAAIWAFGPFGGGCPGSAVQTMKPGAAPTATTDASHPSVLANWPLQLALIPPTAPWLAGADLLLAADCVSAALPGFQQRLLAGRVLVIACPKLDDRADAYVKKLEAIFRNAGVRSVTVAHMEVPCCSGIVHAAQEALKRSGRTDLPFRDVTVGIDGTIRD